MKIEQIKLFVRNGSFAESSDFATIMANIEQAIRLVTWHEPDRFVIHPKVHGNGVTPIKENFIKSLKDENWLGEQYMSITTGVRPGKIDAIKKTAEGIFAVEWETGNISSSHRALNKIAVGIIQQHIIGGILVLPTRKFGKFLTDRVGNYEELMSYFPMYEHILVKNGVMGVVAIEHDDVSTEALFITKGKDGNADKTIGEIEGGI